MPELQCTYQDLLHTHRSLDYLCHTAAINQCSEEQDFVNFFKLYWCHLNGNIIFFLIIALILIFFIFKYTSIVVDEYIAEGIEEITEFINFSEALSGVTLVAFANGAGDVITALIAGDSSGGVSYNIGALYGAGLFVCSMVVAICILQGGTAMVFDKWIVYRDIGFYILATLATIGFAFVGKITTGYSIAYLVLYVIMVIFVVIQERYEDDDEDDDKIKTKESIMTSLVAAKDKEVEEEKEEEEENIGREFEYNVVEQNKKKKVMKALPKLRAAVRIVMATNYIKTRLQLKREQRHDIPLREKKLFDQILTILDYPFQFILYFTAAPCNDHYYSRTRTILFPTTGFVFYYFVMMKTIDMNLVYYGLIPGLVLSFIFLITLPKDGKMPDWSIALVILGIISGLIWTYVLIGLLIDLLNCMGVIMNLDKTYLGLTILAIGNALPDALTTITFVKQGFGTLAISGGYAGQLFGLLIGFGVSMLKVTLQRGPQTFDLFNPDSLEENMLSIVVLVVSLVVLVFTYIFGLVNKFRMNEGFAWVLLGVYILFILGSTGFAIETAIKTA